MRVCRVEDAHRAAGGTRTTESRLGWPLGWNGMGWDGMVRCGFRRVRELHLANVTARGLFLPGPLFFPVPTLGRSAHSTPLRLPFSALRIWSGPPTHRRFGPTTQFTQVIASQDNRAIQLVAANFSVLARLARLRGGGGWVYYARTVGDCQDLFLVVTLPNRIRQSQPATRRTGPVNGALVLG